MVWNVGRAQRQNNIIGMYGKRRRQLFKQDAKIAIFLEKVGKKISLEGTPLDDDSNIFDGLLFSVVVEK